MPKARPPTTTCAFICSSEKGDLHLFGFARHMPAAESVALTAHASTPTGSRRLSRRTLFAQSPLRIWLALGARRCPEYKLNYAAALCLTGLRANRILGAAFDARTKFQGRAT